jgi:3'-phosphoadenosine 5'-phosphosulfate sulfotransferase (PAPS reductase)/FAD synthetase
MMTASAEGRRSTGRTLDPLPHAWLLSADRRGRERGGDPAEVIQEMLLTTTSERQGRAIDKDAGGASMEKKKQEGYF